MRMRMSRQSPFEAEVERPAMADQACGGTQRSTEFSGKEGAQPHGKGGLDPVQQQGEEPHPDPIGAGHVGGARISAALVPNIPEAGMGQKNGGADGAQQISRDSGGDQFQSKHYFP